MKLITSHHLCLDPTFFPGRAAKIFYRPKANAKEGASGDPLSNPSVSKEQVSVPVPTPAAPSSKPSTSTLSNVKDSIKSVAATIIGSGPKSRDVDVGILGILHPTVLANFEIGYPCSALEFDLELFKKEVVNVWE